MNVKSDGQAVAFGRLLGSNESQVVASAWPITTDDPVTTMNNLTYKGTYGVFTNVVGSDKGNLSTAYITPTDSVPSNMGYVLNICGCNNNHAQLWLPTSKTGSMYLQGTNSIDTGYTWREVLDSSNCANYGVKLHADWVKTQGEVSVEQSTVDGVKYPACTWTYRKWDNGLIECFGSVTVTNHACSSNTIGNGLFYQHEIILPKLPTGVFPSTVTPNILISWQGSQALINFGVTDSSSAKCGTVLLCRFNNDNITGKINIMTYYQ